MIMRRRSFVIGVTGALLFLAPSQFADEFKFPLKPNSVRFSAIGDMGTGDSPEYETSDQMVQQRRAFPFDFVIMLGDNLYGGHSSAAFEKEFASPYKALLDGGVKFYASLGNHDDASERFYKPFNMNGANYYSFKKGNVHFFALDSNYMDPKQLDWLQKQLQSAGNDEWKICFFHHPLYSSARKHGPATDLRLLLEPIFIKYGVNVVFAGHEHVYERIRPQNGIYYFTEGSSGQLRSGGLDRSSITANGFDSDRAFMLIEIADQQMYFETVSRTGTVVDSGVIQRQQSSEAAKP
jgi:3',5'-cyclic AMP phosphodiesterase CpdA